MSTARPARPQLGGRGGGRPGGAGGGAGRRGGEQGGAPGGQRPRRPQIEDDDVF